MVVSGTPLMKQDRVVVENTLPNVKKFPNSLKLLISYELIRIMVYDERL